jgi:hypothetical protein
MDSNIKIKSHQLNKEFTYTMHRLIRPIGNKLHALGPHTIHRNINYYSASFHCFSLTFDQYQDRLRVNAIAEFDYIDFDPW